MGGGVGGVWPPVHDERYGLPDMGVYISRLEGRNMGLGPQGRREPAPRLRRRSRPLRRCAIEHALPSPGLADLRLDLDRYTRTFGTGSVEHFIHPVDHGLLEPRLGLLGIFLVSLDQKLILDAGYARLTLFGARQLLPFFCY